MQTARQPLRAIDIMIYHRIMKPVRFIVALWPVLLCAAIWQLLQFAPADQWWWLQKATDPLTTTLIIYATWRYSDRQQSTTRLLLVALVLFVMAGSVMAFLPFAYFIVGLGVFLLAHLVLCVINLQRLACARRAGKRWHHYWTAVVAVGYILLAGLVVYRTIPQAGSAILAGAMGTYAVVIAVMATSAAVAARTGYQLRWWWAALGGAMLAASDALLALRLFAGMSEPWLVHSIMPLYWGGLVCYVAASRPKENSLAS